MHSYDASPSPSPQPPTRWAPYAQYYTGQVVWSAGTIWRCEAAHTSGVEPGGAPANNFQLWTPLSSASQSGYNPSGSSSSQNFARPPFSPPRHFPPGQYVDGGPDILSPVPLPMPSKPPSPGLGTKDGSPDSTGTITAENSKSRGFGGGGRMDMDYFASKAQEGLRYLTVKEERRKAQDKNELKDELKGKRIWRTGGIGVLTHSGLMEDEGRKQDVWREWTKSHGKDDWLKAAKARTDFYNRETRGVKPLFMWKLVDRGGPLPFDAIPIGHEDNGAVLYSARAWWGGGIHLGKAGAHLVNGASISYGGAELQLDIFEVFCGPADPDLIKWMTFQHGERAKVEGWQPVEGGREADGTAIMLAKGEFENGEHPSNTSSSDNLVMG